MKGSITLKIVLSPGENTNIILDKADAEMDMSEFQDLDKEYLFTSVSNTGDYGACSGKKAWRCGGAYLGRLVKMGLLRRVGFYYYISQKGIEEMKEYESKKGGRK